MIAKWHGQPYHDIANSKWLISFETDSPPAEYDKTKDKPLTVDIKQYREGRSLNANAYFHVLCDKIAKVLRISAIESKNMMLARYGQLDEDVNHIILDDDIEWQKVESLHLRPTAHTKLMDNGKYYRVYLVIRGSHTYDTLEMSQLIDGTVDEAKALGIETMTENELRHLKEMWNGN